MVLIDCAKIPYCAEAWTCCTAAKRDEGTAAEVATYINRSASLVQMRCNSDSAGLTLNGCGIYASLGGAKRAHYDIDISVITPYLKLMNDGKNAVP